MKKIYFLFIAVFLMCAAENQLRAEMRNSVTQYGITWTFDTQYECGQFVTGDWWVVGPVTIVGTDPAQTSTRNGSVLNPSPGGSVGYDSRMYKFSESAMVNFPLTTGGLNSLVSTISNPEEYECVDGSGKNGWISRRGSCEHSPCKTMAVLTIVDAPVPDGTFRPSYIGSNNKELVSASNLDYNTLPHLPQLATTPNIDEMIIKIERPWLDHFNTWIGAWNFAIDNSQGYSRETSNDISDMAAALMLDIPELELLTRYMVQRGIDIYGGIQNGAIFEADGGNGNARKWPVLFAGKVLNHAGMLNIGNDFPVITFGEDCQTYYLPDGQPWWGIRHCYLPSADDLSLDTYRICCTSSTWVGQMLTAMMLGLREEWNHEAYFDYVDRWITVEGRGFGGNHPAFIQELWTTYRNNLPAEIPHNGGVLDTNPPTVPTGLNASNTTGNSVTLNWTGSTDNVRVIGYDIYCDNVFAKTVPYTDLSTDITGLSCNTTYSFTVLARDGSGNYSDFSNPVNVTTTSVCDPVNLALNKPVTVTSYDPAAPGENLVDGNTADEARWSASGFPQWAEIDLGADYDLTQVYLYPYQDRPYQYIIEGKTEGGSYSTLVDRSANTESGDYFMDNVSATARYLKITVSAVAGNTTTWVSLNELKVFGVDDPSNIINVTGVNVSPTEVSIHEGQTTDLTETISPSNATDKTVIWSSDTPAVATVDANGLVTAVSAGTAIITVTTNDGSFTAQCAVTITAQPDVDNVYYCDPVNGNMANDGSEFMPWSSLADVFAQGKTFESGDVIYLMDGNHGSVDIQGVNTDYVTITALPGANPEIDFMTFHNASKWIISDLEFSPDFTPVDPYYFVYIYESSIDNIIENCELFSTQNSSAWSESDWSSKAWSAFYIEGPHNTVRNCNIKNVKWGFRVHRTAPYTVAENNTIENLSYDGIQSTASYCTYQYNTIKNVYAIDDNHDDFFQCYSLDENWNVGTTTVYGVTVSNNTFICFTDPNQPFKAKVQGIGCFAGMYEDWVIENNLIILDMWQGLALYGAVNCTVTNNTVLKNPIDAYGMTPWIYIDNRSDGTPSTGNTIKNNISTDLQINTGAGDISNNIQTTDYSLYFADYDNFDFHLSSGSPAIDAGVATGAPAFDLDSISRPQGSGYDVGCYESEEAFISVTGITTSPQTLVLEIGQTSSITASIEPTNATDKGITWSTSDATVATVDDNGTVNAVNAGNCTISAETNDGNFTASCNITVNTIQIIYESVTASVYDNEVRSDGSTAYYTGETIRVGGSGGSYDGCAVYPFQLPELEQGESIRAASLSINLKRIAGSPGGNVDLYGLAYRSTSNVSAASDYWQGSYGSDANGTALQDDFATLSSLSGNIVTNTIGEQNLTDYINAQYAAGAQGGDYIFIRLNPDIADVGNYTFWEFYTANSAQKPVLDLEIETYSVPSVINVTGISVSPGSLTIETGQSSDLTEMISPENASDQSVIWSSDNPSVASVDASGTVSAIGNGSAIITVTTNDGNFTASCSVTVITTVTGVSISTTSLNLLEGGESDIDAIVLPANASNASVSWSSGNPLVATVDANGLVAAIEEGTTNITVTTADGGFTAVCTVTVSPPQIRDESVTGSTNDNEIRSDGSSAYYTGETIRVGGSGGSYDGCAVYPFQLPILDADETINAASLSINLKRVAASPAGNVDLYGLPYRSTSTVSAASDYWQGSFGNDPNGTAIQDDFATINSLAGDILTDATGEQNLADYINAQYASGAQGGDFIFIRLNPDITDVANYNFWEFYTANSTQKPVLNLEIIGNQIKSQALKVAASHNDNLLVKIYPQPVSGSDFYIEYAGFEKGRNVVLSIFDINGRIVYSTSLSVGAAHEKVLVSTNMMLNKGVYFAKLSVTNYIKVVKLIVK